MSNVKTRLGGEQPAWATAAGGLGRPWGRVRARPRSSQASALRLRIANKSLIFRRVGEMISSATGPDLMRYYVEIDGRTVEVVLGPDGVQVDGRRVEVDLRPNAQSHIWHLLLDGKSHTLSARRREERGGWQIEMDGRRHDVLALDERRRAIRSLAGSALSSHGPVEVKAPMPGLVITVEVDRDARVERGQGLVVIEAMKMENEVKASVDGRVTDVRIAAGQAVDKGQTLLVIDPGLDEAASGDASSAAS